ncbi:THAP domain-containing protein 9, partial [Acromyrmex echinatior]
MGRHCCVLGCSTGVSLPSHMFPKDVIMMNKWKKAIYSEKIQDLTDEQLRKCVVCYRHFADSDYEAMYRLRRLKPGVIPSLYL